MKKLILITMMLVMIGIASAATFTHTASKTTVAPNEQFTITYSATGDGTEWFVAWHEESTGCTPATYENFLASTAGGTKTDQQTFTAPASGTCTISPGYASYYQFGSGSQYTLTPITITVSSAPPPACTNGQTQSCTASNGCTGTQTCSGEAWGSCTTTLQKCSDGSCLATCPVPCADSTWTPDVSTVCSGQTFTQNSNCGNTKSATGTKDCTTPCTDSTWSPEQSTVCSSVTFTQSSNCGHTRDSTGTKTCGGGGNFDACAWTTWNTMTWFGEGSECTTAYVMGVGGFIVLMIILSKLGG